MLKLDWAMFALLLCISTMATTAEPTTEATPKQESAKIILKAASVGGMKKGETTVIAPTNPSITERVLPHGKELVPEEDCKVL